MASRPILMPKLGLTMEEGTLAEWKVAPGDRVSPGDVIFVVETDKIASDIEATEEGVVEALRAKAGDVVPVGDVVATLSANAIMQKDYTTQRAADFRVRSIATPQARRLARRAGVDLRAINGSGPRGRIVARDVTAVLMADVPEAQMSSERPPETARPPDPGRDLRPLGHHRKVLARRMQEAKGGIPHFYIFAEADVTSLLDMRATLNSDAGPKVSVNHFILTAVARAVAATPEINIVWSNEELLEFREVNVGIAIETPKGLVAPVLRDIGVADVDEIAQAATLLVERARANRLTRQDLEGGATSVSNVGMFGATGLLAIINPGQSSILGVGCAQRVFRPDEYQQPRLRHVLSLSLSCDHRVIDGALAARFLHHIQKGLQAPVTLLRRSTRGSAR